MQDAIRCYSDEVRRAHGIDVHIRVGLNSGEVVVRAIGNDLHMDYSAIGQTTHLAARMEQLASPGTIRLTAETLRLAEGLVRVTALGPVPVKGLADPVEMFELVGAGPASHGACRPRRRGGLPPSWGGRRSSRPCTRPWSGPGPATAKWWRSSAKPGVGKSRLFAEFSIPTARRAGGSRDSHGVVRAGHPLSAQSATC